MYVARILRVMWYGVDYIYAILYIKTALKQILKTLKHQSSFTIFPCNPPNPRNIQCNNYTLIDWNVADVRHPPNRTHKLTQLRSTQRTKKVYIYQNSLTKSRDSLPLPQKQHHKPEEAIDRNNPNEDANPLTRAARRVPVLLKNSRSADLAVARRIRRIHAVTASTAGVRSGGEFVNHHSLEDVCLFNFKTPVLVFATTN